MNRPCSLGMPVELNGSYRVLITGIRLHCIDFSILHQILHPHGDWEWYLGNLCENLAANNIQMTFIKTQIYCRLYRGIIAFFFLNECLVLQMFSYDRLVNNVKWLWYDWPQGRNVKPTPTLLHNKTTDWCGKVLLWFFIALCLLCVCGRFECFYVLLCLVFIVYCLSNNSFTLFLPGRPVLQSIHVC